MSDERPKMWIEQYDLNIGVRGGPQDSLDDVRDHFDELLADAVDRDPNLGDGVDDDTPGVQ
jgi:hypothetical protein